jgi:hypothetical protein
MASKCDIRPPYPGFDTRFVLGRLFSSGPAHLATEDTESTEKKKARPLIFTDPKDDQIDSFDF